MRTAREREENTFLVRTVAITVCSVYQFLLVSFDFYHIQIISFYPINIFNIITSFGFLTNFDAEWKEKMHWKMVKFQMNTVKSMENLIRFGSAKWYQTGDNNSSYQLRNMIFIEIIYILVSLYLHLAFCIVNCFLLSMHSSVRFINQINELGLSFGLKKKMKMVLNLMSFFFFSLKLYSTGH